MYRQGESSEGRWSILRIFGTGWDAIHFKNGGRFIQFGKNPVKFICIIPKGGQFPLFLMGMGWTTVFCRGRLRVGSTTRPKNFKQLWERSDAYRSSTRVQADRQLT